AHRRRGVRRRLRGLALRHGWPLSLAAGWALAVLLVFAHAQQGAAPAIGLLRGFFPAMWDFALFCLVVALTMVPLGPGLAFLLALASQGAVHGIVLWRMLRVRSGQWPA